jgi:PTS system trehalose-specific IIC component
VPEVWNFGLFTIAKVGYQAQVIPALLAGLALGFIETRLKRIVPDYLYLVVVPVCSLILAVFLAHAFIGPFGRMIGDGVAFAVRHLMTGSFAPIGAALFGFLYAPLVITGVHRPRWHRYADDSEHGRYAGVAADCAVQHCPGVGGGRHHHRQPQAERT